MLKILSRAGRLSASLTRCSYRSMTSFRADDLQTTLCDKPAVKPDSDKLRFGTHISDHMLEIDWTEEHGWTAPHIHPVEPLRLHPSAKVFHYAVELYEGMKAYRCVDGKLRLFRPGENMARMARTAERTCLPDFDEGELLKCIKQLVSLEQAWVPDAPNCSLYVRPTFIGTEPTLGISMSNEAKLFVIAGPVGAYFPTGMKPIKLLADTQHVRAWPGGSGAYKMGSNYAPTIYVQQMAIQEYGCQQVLWLYGDDHQMTEVGTMNLFVYWINEHGEEELVTPSLESGLILPGVTRKSVLELTREWSEFKVSEKTITMQTFKKAVSEGRVKEVFGAGTACIVCPVSHILYQEEELVINTSEDQQYLTQRLYKEINDIHYGRKPHHWMECVEDDVEEIVVRAFEDA